MQRLTWKGIALHAGRLPGYPASHGCIRLPTDFARLLYGVTKVGMTVVITTSATTPRYSPTPEIALMGRETHRKGAAVKWHPEKSPAGPVSIVVSAADSRAVVLRAGVETGSAPVRIEGPVTSTWAYALRGSDQQGQHWLRLQLSNGSAVEQQVAREEWKRFHAPEEFKQAIAGLIQPGTTIIVTADSLSSGDAAAPVTVIEAE